MNTNSSLFDKKKLRDALFMMEGSKPQKQLEGFKNLKTIFGPWYRHFKQCNIYHLR